MEQETLEILIIFLKDTINISGSMQVAPGSEVTVLFPGESHVLQSQDMSGEMPGQKSKFSCQYCNLPMTVGDVAIFCERAGTDKVTSFIIVYISLHYNEIDIMYVCIYTFTLYNAYYVCIIFLIFFFFTVLASCLFLLLYMQRTFGRSHLFL